MPFTMIIALAIHIVSAVIWVGGMFFAYSVLRPSMGTLEAAPDRLRLWRAVFARFFRYVIIEIVLLLGSGYWMIFMEFGGFAGAGMHIHIMNLTGFLMMGLFGHLYFAEWLKFRRAVDAEDFPTAGARLNRIRLIVGTNLGLGWVTIIVGATGRYWG
ncbi:CopD family protein [Nisaea denitrificans]|uniref:CopD family protein n=1 Tax=Nisaea denitrificans TaxID=390877 RepID=UPI0004151C7B|nr:CopD family protein [Nisaea denitrificans]